MVGRRPVGSTHCAVLKLRSRHRRVEDLADRCAAGREFVACGLDVRHNQVETSRGARRGRRDVRPELNRTSGARRGELADVEPVVEGKVGILPPAEHPVETSGAIDVGHRNDDGLEFGVDRSGRWLLNGLFIVDLCAAHWTSWDFADSTFAASLLRLAPSTRLNAGNGWM